MRHRRHVLIDDDRERAPACPLATMAECASSMESSSVILDMELSRGGSGAAWVDIDVPKCELVGLDRFDPYIAIATVLVSRFQCRIDPA